MSNQRSGLPIINLPSQPDGLLLAGGAVVCVDDEFTVHDPGWVMVQADRIVDVGPGAPPASAIDAASRIIDTSGGVVMPGMVNAHTHLFQTFFRGLADDKSLLDWLTHCIWPGAAHLDASSAGLAAALGLVENLRGGATSVIDHQYIHASPGIDHAIMSVAEQIGIRFLLARGWADRNYDKRLMESPESVLGQAAALHERWHGVDGGRLRMQNGPLIPWGCSDQTMAAALAQARSWGVGTHIHCAETSDEVQMSLDERGVRHVRWLESLDALGPDVQLAHAVWLDDDEIDVIVNTRAVVVHCPVSNMYLASGVPRVVEMAERGVTVALASDGPGSNNRQDMFEVLKAAALLQKVNRLDPVALQPHQVINMACRGGASALGQPDLIGVIEPGRQADLLVVNLESVFTAPVHRIPSALVFSAPASNLTHVIVDGRILIDDGELTMVDEASLIAQAEQAAANLFATAQIPTRLTNA